MRERKTCNLYVADEPSGDGESGHAGPGELDDHVDAHVGEHGRRAGAPHGHPRPLRLRRHERDDGPPPPPREPGRRGWQRAASGAPSSGHGGGCRGRGRGRPPPGCGHRSQRIGGVRGEVQAEAHQAGRDAGGRGQGVGQPEAARCRRPVPVDDMPIRVPHVVPQQHDRVEADPPSVARGGGGAGEEQEAGPGRPVRAARRGEEEEEDQYSSARETIVGGVFRCPAAAVRREDRRDRGETRPEEERGQGVVLQPAAEAEAHEIRCPTLTRGWLVTAKLTVPVAQSRA